MKKKKNPGEKIKDFFIGIPSAIYGSYNDLRLAFTLAILEAPSTMYNSIPTSLEDLYAILPTFDQWLGFIIAWVISIFVVSTMPAMGVAIAPIYLSIGTQIFLVPTLILLVIFKGIPWLMCENSKGRHGLHTMFGSNWFFGIGAVSKLFDKIFQAFCKGLIMKVFDKISVFFKEYIKNPVGQVAIFFVRIFNIIIETLAQIFMAIAGICDARPEIPLKILMDPLYMVVNAIIGILNKIVGSFAGLCKIGFNIEDIRIPSGSILNIQIPDIDVAGIGEIEIPNSISNIQIPDGEWVIGLPDFNFDLSDHLGDLCEPEGQSLIPELTPMEQNPFIDFGDILGGSSGGFCNALDSIAEAINGFSSDIEEAECKVRAWKGGQAENGVPAIRIKNRDGDTTFKKGTQVQIEYTGVEPSVWVGGLIKKVHNNDNYDVIYFSQPTYKCNPSKKPEGKPLMDRIFELVDPDSEVSMEEEDE